MPLLDDLLAHLVDPSSAHPVGHDVQNLFGALFGGNAGGSDNLGLPDLIKRMEDAGLGPIVYSWTGPGPALPITPDQLRSALGDDTLKSITKASTAEHHDILTDLAQLLPGVVARMTHPG